MKTLQYLQTLCYSLSQSMDSSEINVKLSQFKDQIEDEIKYIVENKQHVHELLETLFPQGIPDNSGFYTSLTNIPNSLEFGDSSYQLLGLLWSQAYRQLPPNRSPGFLDYWVQNDDVQFWNFILALETFLLNAKAPSNLISKLFLKISNAVRNDMAGGNFYKAVEAYAFSLPSDGLEVLDQYLEVGLDDTKLHIAAVVLGVIRSKSFEDRSYEEAVNIRDLRLKGSPKTIFRLCYLRSWSVAFSRGGVSYDKIRSVLDSAMEGTSAEQDESFAVIDRCLIGQSNEDVLEFALGWLNRNVSSGLSSNAKLSVLTVLSRVQESRNDGSGGLKTPFIHSLILAIQPIDVGEIGLWKEVESILVSQLKESARDFNELLIQITERNPKPLIEHFKNREFSYLISEMNKEDVRGLVTECVFSKSDNVRRLGSVLFQRVKIDGLSDEVIKGKADSELNAVLWEFVRGAFDGESTARFLILLEPLYRNASDHALADDFEQEMVLQAINFPGACLDKWKELENPSDLLNRVIAKAEDYFEQLQSVKDSPAYSFEFPGLREADENGRRVISKSISESVREKSLFQQFVKRVSLLYGDSWCILGQGDQKGIGESLPLHDFSTVMEIPRLEILTPEMMALRRLKASVNLQGLSGEGLQRA